MSGTGKFCLVVTLLLMLMSVLPIPAPWGGWIPQLLVIHNEWSVQLRDAKADVQSKQETELAARMELNKASAEIDALTIGWDRVWHVAGNANSPQAPRVQVLPNGNLLLVNLGQQQGITGVQTTDENGGDATLQPIIHAFYGNAEGGMSYAGEFKATTINPTGAELTPIHITDPAVRASWPQNGGAWRLRSMIPSGTRSRIDELKRQLVRVRDLIKLTNDNIARQQALLQEAQDALAVRRGELLGDPNREDVKERPEFKEGLLKVTERVEEERDQLLLDVDTLRRGIKSAGEDRDGNVDALQKAAEALPAPSTDSGQSVSPQVARGE